MSAKLKQKKLTPEEYLELEDRAEFRSEFWNGAVVEMSGGTESHNTLTLNIAAELRARLRGHCRVFAIDVKVWVSKWNSYVYPDVFAICGESVYYGQRRDIVTNPTLIVEVLSDSTKAFDKGDKFLAYQDLESLQEYVLVDQNRFLIEQYIKQNDGGWKYFATIGAESEVMFFSVNQKLKVSEIYDSVDFETEQL